MGWAMMVLLGVLPGTCVGLHACGGGQLRGAGAARRRGQPLGGGAPRRQAPAAAAARRAAANAIDALTAQGGAKPGK